MKKKFMLLVCILISILCFTSCQPPMSWYPDGMEDHDFDFDEIEELVTNYIEDKYGVDCKMTEGSVKRVGGEKYVSAHCKIADDDNDYTMKIYPDTDKDNDGDGYYDSYYIEFDDYFTTYIHPKVSEWIYGLAEQYISFDDYLIFATLGYEDLGREIQAPKDVDEIIQKGDKASIAIYIIIKENEYTDESTALNNVKELTEYLEKTNMNCWGYIHVYNEELYETVSSHNTYRDYIYNMRGYSNISSIDMFN